MSATVVTLPPANSTETIEFLRRLAGVMGGGKSAETLQEAASLIETLTRRTTAAERLYHEQQEDYSRNVELREAAELAADNLKAEVASLKAQLATNAQQAESEIASLNVKIAMTAQQAEAETASLNARFESEIASLKAEAEAEITSLTAEIAEGNRRAEQERSAAAEEVLRLQANVEAGEARLAEVSAQLMALRNPITNHSVAMVPVQSLQLVRTQFGFLADGFARTGDIISLTICEIGACAIETALADHAAAAEAH